MARSSSEGGGDYDHIILPGGDRFDIPEGEDKQEWIQFFDQARRATREVIVRHGDGRPADGINRAAILPNSTHHDGSIYTITNGWHKQYRISDPNETQLQPMALTNPSNCYPNQETCGLHFTRPMMQIFSIQLGKITMDRGGPVQIYGYIASRDTRDSLRNYVFNRSRDNPITLDQGSLIEMIGPKRGIEMLSAVLIEYDMRIKKVELEAKDIQLIDGVSDFGELTTPCKPFLSRIDGVGGAVDITLAMFNNAVEATIEVDISEVHGNGFSLQLSSSVSGLEKEIQLFHGFISQSCGLRRFVVAVVRDTWMHLNFKFSFIDEVERCASFKAKKHGYASQQIKLDEASVMVKVTWSTW